jgi:hypothetical protein
VVAMVLVRVVLVVVVEVDATGDIDSWRWM